MKEKTKQLFTGVFKSFCNFNYLKILFQSASPKELKRNIRTIAVDNVEFDIEPYKEFLSSNSKKVLLVSQELSWTGAPMALLNLAKHLQKKDNEVFIFSLIDGPLRSEFENINIPVKVFNFFNYNKLQVLPFIKQFDFAIANTCISYEFVKFFEDEIPLIWWIHEAKTLESYVKKNKNFRKTLKKAKNIYVGTTYTKSFIEKYNSNVSQLTYFLDEFDRYDFEKTSKMNFSIIASIDERKAQDVVIDAIFQLPQVYLDKVEFNFIGIGATFYQKLKEKTKNTKEIKWHGLIKNKEEYRQKLSQTDVLICVSRDDPDPIVVTEACMLGIPCIVSKNVGQCEYINDFENGFIVETENSSALAETIKKIVDNRDLLDKIGENAKEIYQKNYTKEIFDKRLTSILKENKNRGKND